MRLSAFKTLALAAAASLCLAASGLAPAQQPAPRVLKMQSTWPASSTRQEKIKMLSARVDKKTRRAR